MVENHNDNSNNDQTVKFKKKSYTNDKQWQCKRQQYITAPHIITRANLHNCELCATYLEHSDRQFKVKSIWALTCVK